MNEREIHEAMDACRSGSDDLSLPEMAALASRLDQDAELRARFARSQEFDAALGAAFQDVPLPEGLEERLLARLAFENNVVEPATDTRSPDDVDAASPASQTQSATARQIIWRAGLAISAVAVVVAMMAVFLTPNEIPALNPTDLTSKGVAYVQSAIEADDWRIGEPPDDYPPSKFVLVPVHGWQQVVTDYDREAVAYDVTPRDGPTATLLVLRPGGEVYGFPSGPPGRPQSTTGGRSIAAWQQDELVFLLVIAGEGHADAYQRMTNAMGPVAAIVSGWLNAA
jgi:hypothetical protein